MQSLAESSVAGGGAVYGVETRSVLAIRTTEANGAMLSTAFRCARLARWTQSSPNPRGRFASNAARGAILISCRAEDRDSTAPRASAIVAS